MTTALLALSILAQPQDDGYMRMVGYRAASHKPDTEAPGGFAPSENYPTAVGPVRSSGRFRLTLTIASAGVGTLKVTNQYANEMIFRAQDSALPIVQEAKDSKGIWRPIEFLPPADCGNSYHRLFLPGDHEWTFSTFLEQQGTKTRIRARMTTDTAVVYSNEIDGFIGAHRFELSPQHSQMFKIQNIDGIPTVINKRAG